ncbi:MAG: phage tail tape measure protein [Sporolactobacillus sp.]|jgi:TP901 family phage tail tape measure protein|nr:phage tail tape measure protein [Sporolactobacillus sp.]
MADMDISFKISAIDDFSRTMRNFSSQLSKISAPMRAMGAGMAAAGGAVAAGLGYAVKTSADFGSQMSKVGALAGASGKQMGQLKDAAVQMGAKSVFSASQVADGMSELGAAGFSTKQIISAMPGVLNAAAASGSDMAETSEVITSALNTFQMKASDSSHVADVMAATSNKTAAGMSDMGYAFKYAATPAHALGFSLESVAAATGIMANAGIKGEQAGTTLREAMLRLANPPKAAANELKNLGISLKDAHGNMLPLDKIIGQFSTKTAGMSKTQKTAALSTIFGTNAVSGMLAVVNAGPAKFDKMQKSLEHSDGSAKKTANTMQNNLKGALEQLSGSLESAAITVGDALTPALTAIAGVVQRLVQGFLSLPKQMQSFIAIGAAVAAVGALLGGALLIGASMIPAITAGLTALVGALTAVILPIVGVVAAIGAVGAAFYLAYTRVAGFRNGINTALSAISGVVMTVFNAVSSFVMAKVAALVAFWNQYGAVIIQAVTNVFNVIRAVVSAAMSVITPIIRGAMSAVRGIFSAVWGAIKGIVSGALNVIMGIVKVFAGLFTGNWRLMWNGVRQILSGVWGAIKAVIKGALGVIRSVVSGAWSAIRGVTSSVFHGIWGFLKSIWGSISSSIGGFLSGIVGHVKSAWSSAKSATGRLVGQLKDAAISKFWDIVNWVKGFPGRIGSAIINNIGHAVDGIKKLASSLVKKFKDMLGIHSPSKVFQNLGKYITQGLVNGLGGADLKSLGMSVLKDFGGGAVKGWNAVKGFFSGLLGGGGAGSSKNVTGWLTAALGATGTSMSWLPGMQKLVAAESGGNPTAINGISVLGQHATGLLQVLPSTFAANAVNGLGSIMNPVANAAAAINYIKSRYGSVFNTPLFKGGSYKGYAKGGRVNTDQWAWVGENGPELMKLNAGSSIIPHDESLSLLNGIGSSINRVASAQRAVTTSTRSMAANGVGTGNSGGRPVVIENVIQVDDETLARVIQPALDIRDADVFKIKSVMGR